MNGNELFELLTKRFEIVDAIEHQEIDKRAIDEAVELSRPTIDRAFRELEEYGLIRSIGTNYMLTAFGGMLIEEHKRTINRYTKIYEAKELLSLLGPEVAFPIEVFENSEIMLSDPVAPEEPFQSASTYIETAQTLRILLPVVKPNYVNILLEDSLDYEAVDIVLNGPGVEVLYEHYYDDLVGLLEADHCTLLQTSKSMEYSMVIANDSAIWLGFYDDRGGLIGSIVSESGDTITWCVQEFNKYVEGAEPVHFRGGNLTNTITLPESRDSNLGIPSENYAIPP